MIDRKQGNINKNLLNPLIQTLEIIEPVSNIEICRDKDDNKFINCAKDAKALYIVSGDKDLLVLKNYEDIEIITASEFDKRCLQ